MENVGCGLVVEYGSHEIFQSIRRLIDDDAIVKKALRGLDAYRNEFNWGVQSSGMLSLYESVKEPRT